MPKTRISLAVPTIPREPNTNKDAEVKNAYIDDSQTGNSYVVKRPGFYVGTEAITVGNSRGIYINPNSPSPYINNPPIWYIGSGSNGQFSLNFFYIFWGGAEEYNVGESTVYPDENGINKPWYSTIPNNINNPPSSTSPYWSPSPITTLYYGVYRGGTGPTCGSVGAAGITAYNAFETLNSCANRSLVTGLWRAYAGVSGNSIMAQQWVVSPAKDCSESPQNLGTASFGYVVQL